VIDAVHAQYGVVIDTVFSLPGLGSLLVSSIFTRDYMVVMAITMVLACAIVIVYFIVDIVRMRILDVMLSFPWLVLLIAIITVLRPGPAVSPLPITPTRINRN
jgi:ABC-type antimicrobial peptide transport system permease subunit